MKNVIIKNHRNILQLPYIKNFTKNIKSISFQEFINEVVPEGWKPYEKQCDNCSGSLVWKQTLETSEIIVAQIMLFHTNDKNITVKEAAFKVTDIPKNISIHKKTFHVISAICYDGTHPKEGSYTSIIKEGKSKWKMVNNEKIKETRWPKNA